MKAYKRIIALTLCALTCVCNVTYVSAEETTEINEATNSGVGDNETTGETSTYVYDKLEGTIQRFNTNMMLAYKEKADSYLLYFLLSLVVLATTVITFTIVLMKKKKHKTKFA